MTQSRNESTYVFFGLDSGFCETVRTNPKWTATCTHWQVSKAQLESTADMIKDSKCTWLHCVIDLSCGMEATTAAFKLARQQRRAVGHFLIELLAALESRADDLLKHALTVKSIRGSVCIISNSRALLTTDVFVLEGERLRWPAGAGNDLLNILSGARGRPIDWRMSENPLETTADSKYSKRENARREAAAVGGLRDPRRSIAGKPEAILIGHGLNKIVTGISDTCVKGLESVGQAEAPPVLEQAATKVREAMAAWVQVSSTESGVQHVLVKEIAKRSGDPDVDVPEWLAGRTPLGIDNPTIPRGISPIAGNVVGAEATDFPWRTQQDNYASYQEYQTVADEVLQKERELGRLELAPSLQE